MFKRLRLQLTAISTVGTAVVLIGMAAVSLRFSLGQLERQSREAFRSNVNTVIFYLLSQPVIDQAWLARTEADNGLWVRIESEQAQLQHTHQNSRRDSLTQLAIEHAVDQLGFRRFSPASGSLEPEMLLFEIRDGADRYMAAVVSVTLESGQLDLSVVKSRVSDEAAVRGMAVGFGASVAGAVLLLVGFAWFFSGRATRPVEEANRKQTAFVSAASHELRSPLSVIELSAGTIRSAPAFAPRLAKKIEGECRRMARLIGDLLFLAGTDDGRQSLRLAPVSPKTILLSALERFEPLAAAKEIRLELALPEAPLPDISCDRQLIEQVLAIFLENAIRFAPAGGRIQLGARLGTATLCLSVADSGPGVDEEQKPYVFDRFYRADASRTEKEHYGLGLSIAREIAVLHKARLSVEDSPLGGAEFSICLRRG